MWDKELLKYCRFPVLDCIICIIWAVNYYRGLAMSITVEIILCFDITFRLQELSYQKYHHKLAKISKNWFAGTFFHLHQWRWKIAQILGVNVQIKSILLKWAIPGLWRSLRGLRVHTAIAEDPSSLPSTQVRSIKPLVNPAPGDLTPYSSLW